MTDTYVAVDPHGVDLLADALADAGAALRRRVGTVESALAQGMRSAAAPQVLRTAATLSEDAAADLRSRLHRLSELQVLYRHFGEPGPVFPRPRTTFATVDDARAAGDALAARLDDSFDYTDERSLTSYAPVLGELGQHATDPYFTRAFYDRLGVEKTGFLTLLLTEAIRDYPASYRDESEVWSAYARSLATALRDGGWGDDTKTAYLTSLVRFGDTGELRHLIFRGNFDDDSLVALSRGVLVKAQNEYMHWPIGGLADEDLLGYLAYRPDIAARVLDGLPDRAVQDLITRREFSQEDGRYNYWGFYDHAADFLRAALQDARLTNAAACDSAFLTVLHAAAKHGHVAADVQVALADATVREHMLQFAHIAGSKEPSAVFGLSPNDLSNYLRHIEEGNDTAYATLHAGLGAYAGQTLAQTGALSPTSVQTEDVGAVTGLLARADGDAHISEAKQEAGRIAFVHSLLAAIPIPGGIAVDAVKKLVAHEVDDWKARVEARGQDRAEQGDQDAVETLNYILSGALWQQHPGDARFAPPSALVDAGTHGLVPLDKVRRDPALAAALDGWNSRNGAFLPEQVSAVDDQLRTSFEAMFSRR